ncbi:MAG: pantoate--beta-alanine ligase [Rhodospirillales bacterium]
MANKIIIVRTIAELRRHIATWRADGLSVGLVPTMGALHDGHFSLVEQSIKTTDRTVTTLFVNPKQFGPHEDLDVYPRDEAADVAALAEKGVHMLFAPSLDEMYAEESVTAISVPGIGDVLEGSFRPGFFTGVATVVAKLLIQALPDRAFFGEKDYQQLRVITRMTEDLDIPVEIVGCPIVREEDGLALSSRNAYLSPEERKNAPALGQALQKVKDELAAGTSITATVEAAKASLLNGGFTKVDYIAVCDRNSLEELETPTKEARILGAAWLGKTRLIDNLG